MNRIALVSVVLLGALSESGLRAESVFSHELETPFGRTRPSPLLPRPPRPRLEGVISATAPAREIPRSATLRLGPFYSNVDLSQSIGYRYATRSGVGTDLLYDHNRGEIREDGSEFPLYTTLTMDNHAVLTRYADAHLTIRAENLYFPLNTQENDFNLNLGAGAGAGAEVAARVGFAIGEDVYGGVFNQFSYRVDYRDSRGLEDRYGGERYSRLRNVLGGQLVWDMDKDQFARVDVARHDEWPLTDRFDHQESVSYAQDFFYGNKVAEYLSLGTGVRLAQTFFASDERGTAYRQSAYVSADTRLTEHSIASAKLGYSASELSGASGFFADERDEGTVIGSVSLGTRLAKDFSHWITYSRSQDAGFIAASEIHDVLEYELYWLDAIMPGRAFTRYSSVEPGNLRVSSYSDWTSGVDLSYRLTHRVTLDAMTSYSVRANSDTPAETPLEFRDYYDELLERTDYSTWVSRVGTSVSIHPKVILRVYYKHVERWSDEGLIDYTLDIFEAVATFQHRF